MTRVKIKNFQSIGDVEFDIDGFTLITGKNNYGKSAIMRSIDAALTNKTGSSFIRRGTKTAEIHVETAGLSIDWKKGDKTTYAINGESYSALKGSVPQVLLDHGFRKMEIGDKKIFPMFASQFNELFLVDKTGSVITEVLSKIYGIDIIGKADEACQKEMRTAKGSLKTREGDLDKLSEQLKKFDGFDSVLDKMKKVKELDKECQDLKKQIEDLGIYIITIEAISRKIKSYAPISSINLPDTLPAKKQLEEGTLISRWAEEVHDLTRSVGRLGSINKVTIPEISPLSSDIKELGDIDIAYKDLKGRVTSVKACQKMIEVLGPMTGLTRGSESLKESLDDFNKFLVLEKEFEESAGSAKKSREELHGINNELQILETEKAAFKVCPLCSKPL